MIANEMTADEYARLAQQKPRKYRNERYVSRDGLTFDSKAEARRWAELRLLESQGEIANLRVHTRWPLVVEGVKVGVYVSDFDYFDSLGLRVVEDVKAPKTYDGAGRLRYSGRTAVYRLKKRLMSALYGINIREVEM